MADGERPQSELGRLAMAVRAGVAGAEEALTRQLLRPLRLMCRMRRLQAEDADDLIQETLLVVIRQLRSRVEINFDSVHSYVESIARNLLIVDGRKLGRRRELMTRYEEAAVPQQQPQPEQLINAADLVAAVRGAIASLSQSRDRALLREHYLLERDKGELCMRYALSARHFDRILYNARERLVATLRRRGMSDKEVAE